MNSQDGDLLFSEDSKWVEAELLRELSPLLSQLSAEGFHEIQQWVAVVLKEKVTNFFFDQDEKVFNRFRLFAGALLNIAEHHPEQVEEKWLALIREGEDGLSPILTYSQELWPYLRDVSPATKRWLEYFCLPDWPYTYHNFFEDEVKGRYAPMKKIEYRFREVGVLELLDDIEAGVVTFTHDFESFLLIQRYMLKEVYSWAGVPRDQIDMELSEGSLQPVNICKFQFQYCDPDNPAVDFEKIKQEFGDEFTIFTNWQDISSEAEEIFTDIDHEFYDDGQPRFFDIEISESRIAKFAHTAAPFYLRINQLHPLRDGNGMSQMIFFKLLAHEQGLELDWKEGERDFKDRLVTAIKIYNANGQRLTPESLDLMKQLFEECLSPLLEMPRPVLPPHSKDTRNFPGLRL